MRKRSTQIINIVFMCIPMVLILCWFAQMLAVWGGQAPGFSVQQYLINLPVAYITAVLVGTIIPVVPLGIAFAKKCGAEDGTLKFGLLLNVVLNSIFTVFLNIVMTVLNVVILAKQPPIAAVISFFANFIPVWLVCFVIAFVCSPICQKLAKKCTGEE